MIYFLVWLGVAFIVAAVLGGALDDDDRATNVNITLIAIFWPVDLVLCVFLGVVVGTLSFLQVPVWIGRQIRKLFRRQ